MTICVKIIFWKSQNPSTLFMGKGRVGAWKALDPRTYTEYNVWFHQMSNMWTCTDMQVDVHNITDWHASWRAQHHRKVDMLKQVHIVNGKHIKHRHMLYVWRSNIQTRCMFAKIRLRKKRERRLYSPTLFWKPLDPPACLVSGKLPAK
jgi:hypothetical protein